MIRKPRSFSLTKDGFRALSSCEKCYPHLKRGKLVSIALENMARSTFDELPARFLRHEPECLQQVDKRISTLIEFNRKTRETLINLKFGSEKPNSQISETLDRIDMETEELQILHAQLGKLSPLIGKLTAKDVRALENFLDIAKNHQSDPQASSAYEIAARLLKPLLVS